MARYFCPAKINLALSVGRPRPGDGYHPISSWMVRINLGDDLDATAATGESRFEVRWAADAPSPSPIDWPVEKDLIAKAHRLLEARVGRPLPVHAVLTKRSPVGAGMGGGSSDGATMLRAVNDVHGLALSDAELVELAAKLGSDVAFFLGGPSGIISGVGERLEAVPQREAIPLTLILPPLHCNTGAVYRRFDALRPDAAVDDAAVRRLAMGEKLDAAAPFNDLAAAAEAVEPRLAELRKRCEDTLGRPVHITGSGAAMFVIAESEDDAQRMAGVVRGRSGTAAVAACGGK